MSSSGRIPSRNLTFAPFSTCLRENMAKGGITRYTADPKQKWVGQKQSKTQVHLGLAFQDLCVNGFISTLQCQQTVVSYLKVIPWHLCSLLLRRTTEKVRILHSVSGLVRPGEMLLVLGRPGSGCSTFLKTLAGEMHGIYIEDESKINYEGLYAIWTISHDKANLAQELDIKRCIENIVLSLCISPSLMFTFLS
jgi:ABC-type glutathione transport system ATPase component